MSEVMAHLATREPPRGCQARPIPFASSYHELPDVASTVFAVRRQQLRSRELTANVAPIRSAAGGGGL
jgi:hypothetical protein